LGGRLEACQPLAGPQASNHFVTVLMGAEMRVHLVLSLVLSLVSVTAASLSSPAAFAWGGKGHQVISQAAAGLTASVGAPFFQRNQQLLADFSVTPDALWKLDGHYSVEAPMHFFQWDRYGTSPLGPTLAQYLLSQVVKRLGIDFVRTNGLGVWRISDIYGRLVRALQNHDWSTSIQMAGVLGHYVGDMSQPMHVTSDYDGQSIQRRGIHFYFEVTLVEPLDAGDLINQALKAGGPIRQQLDAGASELGAGSFEPVQALAVREGATSYGELAGVIDKFKGQSQDDPALRAFFGPRMGHGAAVLAKIWDMAVVASGVTVFPTAAVDTTEPEWFPLVDAS